MLDVIQDEVKAIHRILANPTPPRSYAQAAGGKGGSETVPIPRRTYREMVVRTGAETEAQKRRNGRELVEDIQKAGAPQVVAARRLRSGDILLTTTDNESRTQLQKEKSWTSGVGEGAEVRRKQYAVVTHGIKVAQMDMSNKTDAIKAIYTQNPSWKDQVEILNIAWTDRKRFGGKSVSSLIIGVAEPAQGDILIDGGMLWDYQLHDCEPFSGQCRITQCYKCYQYGHIGRMCSNEEICGFCGKLDHKTDECLRKPDPTRHRCPICPGHGKYTAWAPSCPIRKEKREEAQRAYLQRPTRFLPRPESPPTQQFQFIGTNLEDLEGRPRKRTAPDTTWQVVPKRGRPRKVILNPESQSTLDGSFVSTVRTPSESQHITPDSMDEGN
jgi:hypothetical protein